jgi:hypothetical protein
MTVHRTFGRRAIDRGVRTAPLTSRLATPIRATEIAPDEPSGPASQWSSQDEDLTAWKQARRPLPIPWRQLSLMAGLCFGIASLVLPDSVNRAADWLLYALMAASFYAGWRKRRPSA